MNYKVILFLSVSILFFHHSSSAQKIHDVDLTLINSVISVPNSPFEYARLKNRMYERDSTLTDYEFQLLYFGATFQSDYAPYFPSALEERFNDLYESENYAAALPLADSVLKNNPVNLKLTLRAAVCANSLNQSDLTTAYMKMYKGIFQTIISTGDGWSEEHAFVVTSVSDEYEIMAMWEIGYTKQSLLASQTDMFTLDKVTRKELKKDGIKTKGMYFDVSLPFQSLMKGFKESNESKD